MIARNVIPDSSGFPVRWFGGFAVVELPSGRNAIAAAGRENAIEQPGINLGIGQQPHPVPSWRQEKAAAWVG